MGDRLAAPKNTELPLHVHVAGTFPIKRLSLYKNGKSYCELPLNGLEEVRYDGTLPLDGPASYYVEVLQADGEYAWSSPILCEVDDKNQ